MRLELCTRTLFGGPLGHSVVVVVVDSIHTLAKASSTRKSTAVHREILVVALAIQHTLQLHMDTSCRVFLTGCDIPTAAYPIFQHVSYTTIHGQHHLHLHWTPGHVSVQGNEQTNAVA